MSFFRGWDNGGASWWRNFCGGRAGRGVVALVGTRTGFAGTFPGLLECSVDTTAGTFWKTLKREQTQNNGDLFRFQNSGSDDHAHFWVNFSIKTVGATLDFLATNGASFGFDWLVSCQIKIRTS